MRSASAKSLSSLRIAAPIEIRDDSIAEGAKLQRLRTDIFLPAV